MSVLVDSSVWIEYFRNAEQSDVLEMLIEEDLVVTNELILAELIPALQIRKLKELVTLLREIKRQPMNIDWNDIIKMQSLCLNKGTNGVGIPDLIIAQNSIQGGLRLLSNDKHFFIMSKFLPLGIYR
ncbi:MAG: PIN domain-containing protein [Nitrospirae bacterium]|nr:PIN domain-containing protein [Nitrospirota bacterium]